MNDVRKTKYGPKRTCPRNEVFTGKLTPWMSVLFSDKLLNVNEHRLRYLIYQVAQQCHITGASVLFTCQ